MCVVQGVLERLWLLRNDVATLQENGKVNRSVPWSQQIGVPEEEKYINTHTWLQ